MAIACSKPFSCKTRSCNYIFFAHPPTYLHAFTHSQNKTCAWVESFGNIKPNMFQSRLKFAQFLGSPPLCPHAGGRQRWRQADRKNSETPTRHLPTLLYLFHCAVLLREVPIRGGGCLSICCHCRRTRMCFGCFDRLGPINCKPKDRFQDLSATANRAYGPTLVLPKRRRSPSKRHKFEGREQHLQHVVLGGPGRKPVDGSVTPVACLCAD